jgi:hypothetical protein
MASVAAWLPFARAAAIGWAPLARNIQIFSFCFVYFIYFNYFIFKKTLCLCHL